MNNHTNTTLIIRLSLALVLALAIWSPIQTRSAEPAKEKMKMDGKMMMGGKMMTETDMKQCCQEMKEMKEKLAADIKTQDAELTVQIAAMNRAAENEKLDLMAGIVTQMVAQRTDLNERRAKMDEGMMQHMMQHMQMGKELMSQCPMMKDTTDTKGKAKESGDATEKQ